MRVEKCLNEIVNRLNKTKVERKPDLKVDLSQGTRDLTDVKGLQPELPDNMHPKLLDLMQRCWEVTPTDQPSFSQITVELEELLQEVQTHINIIIITTIVSNIIVIIIKHKLQLLFLLQFQPASF
ncbi:uncharacterized protein LOC131251447 isoform X3 [Magnolia sinica]|uniref:uncharacterized protein LOC131251447 isoform X3 n=1 Tax=Magnolia sinica TaxID=86752 RepID=UPI0026584080|nr:uncharacterized protein LOC131251447 isoform X3 [Magnolia sinica]